MARDDDPSACEAYDLAADPYQLENIAGEIDTHAYTALVRSLAAASGDHLRSLEVP
jgi:hypothetical protein